MKTQEQPLSAMNQGRVGLNQAAGNDQRYRTMTTSMTMTTMVQSQTMKTMKTGDITAEGDSKELLEKMFGEDDMDP